MGGRTGLGDRMPSTIFSERYGVVVDILATARRAAGLTQVALAERLGRPQSFVSKIERRERRIDAVELFDWARATGIDAEALFVEVATRLSLASRSR